MSQPVPAEQSIARRTIIVIAVALGIIVPALLFGYAATAVFLLFGGGLFAVFLKAAAEFVQKWTRLSDGMALTVVLVLIAALSVVGTWFFAAPISDQVSQLTTQLPKSIDSLRTQLENREWGQWLINKADQSNQNAGGAQQAVKTGVQAITVLTEGLGYILVIFFVGIYFAVDPGLYLHGVLRLFPLSVRGTVRQAIIETVDALRCWLMGRLLAMAFVGLATGLGLWLLSIPLALLLGLLSGLLSFIPYVGPVISLLPAMLLSLQLHGVTWALYVIGLYLGVQIIQDYVLTPVIQQRTVALPPVLILMSQIFAGIWIGPIGVTFATPFTVVLMVLVRRLYVEEYLEGHGTERQRRAEPGAARSMTS